MRKMRIGIIDDNSSKVTQIMTKLELVVKSASKTKADKYSEIRLEAKEIPLDLEQYEIIKFIREEKIDCILVDYNLSSYENVNFTGVELANTVEEAYLGFPIFILTSYEDELFDHEVYNAYQVFSFSRYISEDAERIELNYKLIEQVLKHEKQIELWKNEMERLLRAPKKTSDYDQRIMELDNLLERSIDGRNAISLYVKEQIGCNKIDKLISKIDELLGE